MGSNAEEDLFIKPGNQERGWNDPPQFSYGLQNRGAHRNILTRRAPPAGTTARRTMSEPKSHTLNYYQRNGLIHALICFKMTMVTLKSL
uniref:Uncharacterized protein n=1 Tax=Neogobius melanostomus TaxID=47308 RepID=A0A8C6T283_9GOBI